MHLIEVSLFIVAAVSVVWLGIWPSKKDATAAGLGLDNRNHGPVREGDQGEIRGEAGINNNVFVTINSNS